MVGRRAKEVGADIVLVVGDITNFGSVEEAEKILSSILEVARVPILFVPGNCDPPQLLSCSPRSQNLINIHAKKRRGARGRGMLREGGIYSLKAIFRGDEE